MLKLNAPDNPQLILQDHWTLVSAEKKRFFGDWNPAWTAIGITDLAIEGLIPEIRAVVLLPS